MSRIFISYKRVDKDKVFKIKDHIESALGEKCWIDLDGIESDAQFANVIINAINECEVFLFMYSKSHNKIVDYENDWTIRELNFAQEKKKRIVFVNIDGSQLSDWTKLFFGTKQQVNGRDAVGLDKLCNDLNNWLSVKKIIKINKKGYERKTPKAIKITFILFASLLALIIGFWAFILFSNDVVISHRRETWKHRIEIKRSEQKWGKLEWKDVSNGSILEGFEAVDIGLSVKWSTCNLGSDYPYHTGGYYQWGDTTDISRQSLVENYGNNYMDVANIQMGGKWRTPTYDEAMELKDKCKFEKKVFCGMIGFHVTGPNGNSIFLPMAGDISESSVTGKGSYCIFWTSTPHRDDALEAYEFAMSITNNFWYIGDKITGHNIRPVHE